MVYDPAAQFEGDTVFLKTTGDYLRYDFQFSADGESRSSQASKVDVTALSPAVIDGYNYTGVYLGLYATSKGAPTHNFADFDIFTYEPTAISPDDWFHRQASDENIH